MSITERGALLGSREQVAGCPGPYEAGGDLRGQTRWVWAGLLMSPPPLETRPGDTEAASGWGSSRTATGETHVNAPCTAPRIPSVHGTGRGGWHDAWMDCWGAGHVWPLGDPMGCQS